MLGYVSMYFQMALFIVIWTGQKWRIEYVRTGYMITIGTIYYTELHAMCKK